jgi:hypothetical protein
MSKSTSTALLVCLALYLMTKQQQPAPAAPRKPPMVDS